MWSAIRAHASCTATMSGNVKSASQSVAEPELAARLRVGADARWVVVGGTGDQPRAKELQESHRSLVQSLLHPAPAALGRAGGCLITRGLRHLPGMGLCFKAGDFGRDDAEWIRTLLSRGGRAGSRHR